MELVKPGASYNPAPGDHQEVLREAVESELRRQRKAGLYRAAARPRGGETEDLIDDNMVTLGDGADGADTIGGGPAAAAGGGGRVRTATKQPERKTRAQRNKEAVRKERARQEEERRRARKLDKQLNRVQAISAELNKELKAKERALAMQKVSKEKALGVPKRLGPHRRRADPWEALLTDELPDSMRKLPAPSTPPLLDRYLSVLKRNLVEPRMRVRKRRRYEPRIYTKKGFKEKDWIDL